MPTRYSLRKGSKKQRAKKDSTRNTCMMDSSASSQTPSEYWNHPELHTSTPDSEQAFLNTTTPEPFFNLYDLGTDIKLEMSSPTAGSTVDHENESEYSDDLTPISNPFHDPFPYSEDDFTLCHAPTADPTDYPIFVSRNGLWDWYYFSSDTMPTETPATPASGAIDEDTKNMKSEFDDDLNILPRQFPYTEDDIILCPYPNVEVHPGDNPTFSSQNRRWEWMYLSSNMNTESTPSKVKMEDIPEASPSTQLSEDPEPATLPAADLNRSFFPVGAGHSISEDDDTSAPPLLDHAAEQARTASHVQFFMTNNYDKHFIPVNVTTLTGHANYHVWLAGMELLFRQHSVWPLVMREIQPLPPTHSLYLWYQRMRDCAVSLIYANVSDDIIQTPCFLGTLSDNDPGDLMLHMFTHYALPDSDSHSDDEFDSD